MISSVKDTYKDEFVDNQLVETQINPSLSPKMRHDLIDVLYTYKNGFASDNEPLGAIKGHEFDITLNIERPYPQVLKRQAYPASPRAREAFEKYIQELIQLGILRKDGWEFRALNTYSAPNRYPIPRIQETLTQLSKDKYITSMDALKGFHQNFLIPKNEKLLRIIMHCGIYEDLRMPFGIKNAPSHYQRMMNTIFPTELSEGCLIIYIDYIIICSDSWSFQLEILARVLDKATGVNMKISSKKCNFGFEELKALGHIVSGLSLGIDKSKVAAVLLKPIPQIKKEMMSFLGFSSYYRKHLKDFEILAKSLYRIYVLQAQRMTLLYWCCGNSNLRPSWGQFATPYLYGQFGPFWCSMEFWPYHSSLAFYGPRPYPAIFGPPGQVFHIPNPQVFILVFGPPSQSQPFWAPPFH
ncbi:hypothetical protein O181_040674 [Austropuccinia psidii MF-1]|uniref:Reverse transcriptase domain-containing protein n=1 Tax=Austropuccinia psidii MF-1 TaxID=1389203 RepID=A0A9Q3DCR0_9BASI|nr:hypothetical protein [Austropuccinia psidii MF-1]